MRRFWLVLFLLLIALPAQAQDDDRFPAPIDPQFTDAVQIVSAQPQIAYTENSFLVWNGTTWDEYEFPGPLIPDTVGGFNVFQVNRQENGLYRFSYRSSDLNSWVLTESDHGWLIDPKTGEFFPLPSICAGLVPDEADRWLPYPLYIYDTPATHLCNSTTGEMTPPFPPDINARDIAELFDYRSPLSPDGEWFIGFGEEMELFAYHFATGQRIHLGLLQPLSYECAGSGYFRRIVYRLRWTTNTHFYLEQEPGGYCFGGTSLYSGDITQPDSLTRFMYTDSYVLFDSGSYFWTEYKWESELMTPQQFAQDCAVREYNLETGHFYLRFIPNVCDLGDSIRDGSGDRIYLHPISHSREHQYEMLRFNPRTGHVETIFNIEIGVHWTFSKDGHYFIFSTTDDDNAHLAVADLHTGTVLDTGVKFNSAAFFWGEQPWDNDFHHFRFYELGVPKILNVETGQVIDIFPNRMPLTSYAAQWQVDGELLIRVTHWFEPEDERIMQSAEWIVQVP